MIQQEKVHLISLGCARNRVDSEVMLGGMVAKGWLITDEPSEADAIVVNTCGFIGPAKEESIDKILEASEYKKANPKMKLVVTGCLTQRYKTQLAKGLPEVDLFIGTDQFVQLPDLLAKPPEKGAIFAKRSHYLYQGELPKLNTLSVNSAYVKVAEGCQHSCAFCIIPAIRGKLRSRPIASVVNEVKNLVQQGVLEINLIAQDLAAYGRDLDNVALLDLLKALVQVENLKWLRMLYVYPENIDEEFLEFFASQDKIVKYIDIPMQHGNDAVLKRMKRNVTRDELRTIVQRVRACVPGVAIRTTVMVGFPGETDAEFADLCSFVEELEFDHLGCFAYSLEEGTVAARYPDQVDEKVKAERLEKIMLLQQKIVRKKLEAKLGQVMPILVDGVCEDDRKYLKTRIASQAPEVDGVLLIAQKAGEKLERRGLQMAKIKKVKGYDLVGELI